MASKVTVPADSVTGLKDVVNAVNAIIDGTTGSFWTDPSGRRWRSLSRNVVVSGVTKSYLLFQYLSSSTGGSHWITLMGLSTGNEVLLKGSLSTSYDFVSNGLEPQ